MGAEQSHQQGHIGAGREALEHYDRSGISRLQKRNTIHAGDTAGNEVYNDGRPTSPPISVCSDSDLPYISYTDRIQIGDSPKIRSKPQIRSNSVVTSMRNKSKEKVGGHNIVVVKSAVKEQNLEMDPDYIRLQNIPMFLPVMRGTLSLPSKRDPEILERLQPAHFQNICSRMQSHYNVCATHVANDQGYIIAKIKEVDHKITKLLNNYSEMQKAYSAYAEVFSKTRLISQQLSRCNTLLNQNIESLEELNNFLDIEDRMEPFIWKTNN